MRTSACLGARYRLLVCTFAVSVAVSYLAGCTFLNVGEDKTALLNDKTPPEITISAPPPNSPYLPVTTVRGTAVDFADDDRAPGGIRSVQYVVASRSAPQSIQMNDDGSFVFEVDTTGLSGSISIRVEAEDMNGNGASATVTLTAPRSMDSFGFKATNNPNSGLTTDVGGVIENYTIIVTAPPETDVSQLVATFAYSGEAVVVNGVTQTSGQSSQDFSSPIEYRVTANDGSVSRYTVNVRATPLAPANPVATATSERAVTLSWQDRQTFETGFTVERRGETETEFTPLAELRSDTTTFQDAGLPPGTTWYYRVRSEGEYGSSGWSVDLTATTQEFPAPDFVDPVVGGTVESKTPTLYWSDVPGAVEYGVQFAEFSEAVTDAVIQTVALAQLPVADTLSNLSTYFWRVRAVNADGFTSPWSAIAPFAVRFGDITGLLPPPDGGTSEPDVTVQWDAVPSARHYEVKVSQTAEALSTAIPMVVDTNQHMITDILETVGDTLFWRVRIRDSDDEYGPWSTAAQVTYVQDGSIGPAGGVVFYDKRDYSDGWRFLEATTEDQGEALQWGGYGMIVGTSREYGEGTANTEAIVATAGTEAQAAEVCHNLVWGGYDDWFLPSKRELSAMGSAMWRGDLVGFERDWYWSSSEADQDYTGEFRAIAAQFPYAGFFKVHNKNEPMRVRACRAF